MLHAQNFQSNFLPLSFFVVELNGVSQKINSRRIIMSKKFDGIPAVLLELICTIKLRLMGMS